MECSGAINNAISIMWHQWKWCYMTKKSCFTCFGSSWPNKCSHATDNAISNMWCQCWHQWCHMTQKVMLHFILIFLTTNAVVSFMMLSGSWDSDSGVTWPESCYTSFLINVDLKCIDTINMISVTWCCQLCQWHQMTKKVMLHLICLS